MGVDGDRGRLEPGLRADLVVVEDRPDDLADIASRVRGVYLDGVLVSSGKPRMSNHRHHPETPA
jgi:imidazolonepropionase-like amidohydrolase